MGCVVVMQKVTLREVRALFRETNDISLEDITCSDSGKSSVKRKPAIADLFYRMGMVARMGSGIERMRGLMRDAGLKGCAVHYPLHDNSPNFSDNSTLFLPISLPMFLVLLKKVAIFFVFAILDISWGKAISYQPTQQLPDH